ncbi:MAG: sulfotransferase [Gammaproteobacteria bacterium]|nr:sulfotransferase [Gammaproteobacteria bacterium]MYH13913.1 sulfotransferase [Gammaproteobacteria bacterium]MYK81634.1 sulfotransferase [Gammaproteobacteria bacterium]
MATKVAKPSEPHVTSMAPLGVWLRLIADNGGVPWRYWGKLSKVLAITALTAPLRMAERLCYSPSRMARVKIDQAPLYIQGFARSGTTHLLNLLARDPSFGVVTTFQAIAAPMFLVGRGWLERLIARGVPATRPMDGMAVSLDLPQEEEVALANTSHLSSVHHLSFPRRTRAYLEKFTTLQLTGSELAQWERAYLTVLRKATLASGGRRLVLKSPTNLGRTTTLLRLFPDAKFIHIVRNPYVVYQSMTHLYRTMLPICQLDDADPAEVTAAIRNAYTAMMRQYMADRASIPSGNLTEVRFEDLEKNPMTELERIYRALSLPGWDQARKPIGDYLRTLSGYRKNAHRVDSKTIDFVNKEWGFAVEAWGYKPPAIVSH